MKIAGKLSKHQSGIVATEEGYAPTLMYWDYKEPVKIMIDKDKNKMDWPSLNGPRPVGGGMEW